MKYTGIILTAAVAVFLLFPTFAEATAFAKVGTAGAQFLKLGLGARGTAMGGAFVATADDPSAVFWNPACLTRVPGTQVQFTGMQWFADIKYGGGIVSKEFSEIGTFAAQFAILNSGEMDLTTIEQPEGTGEKFTSVSWVAGISFARMLTDRFSAGLTVKYVFEGFSNVNAGGIAVDMGTLYDTGFKTLRIGMSIQHFGGELTPDGEYTTWFSGGDSLEVYESYSMPMTFRLGIAMDIINRGSHFLTVEVDGIHPSDNVEQLGIGAEYWYNNMFALRGGYRINTDEEGLTAGAGFNIPVGSNTISLDYAYADWNRLEMVHRASLGFAF